MVQVVTDLKPITENRDGPWARREGVLGLVGIEEVENKGKYREYNK